MMIAARLAGGNLFLLFLVGDFFERSEHSERLGFFCGGILFFGGGGVCFGL